MWQTCLPSVGTKDFLRHRTSLGFESPEVPVNDLPKIARFICALIYVVTPAYILGAFLVLTMVTMRYCDDVDKHY